MDGSLQKRSMIVVHTTVKITTWTTNTITEGQPPTPTTAFTAPLDSESGIEVVTEAHSWTAATYTVVRQSQLLVVCRLANDLR